MLGVGLRVLGVESGLSLGLSLGLKAFEFRIWIGVLGLRFRVRVRLGFWCRV